MSGVLERRSYAALPLQRAEALRYAGCRTPDAAVSALLDECWEEARAQLSYRLVFRTLPLRISGDDCDFGLLCLHSRQLAQNLAGCGEATVFAATAGVGIDRLIARQSRLSPAKAVMLQALGAAQVEALCDTFCAELAERTGKRLRPRFSPGYGDLPLQAQREVFAVLDCERQIGLTLNESLLMSPSKSVTAFVGLAEEKGPENSNPCARCDQAGCAFRRGAI